MLKLVTIIIVGCLLAAIQVVKSKSPFQCHWRVEDGQNRKSPRYAPFGRQKYIVMTKGPKQTKHILGVLKAAFTSTDVAEVRELTGLGNMFTARLSSAAMRWMCEQQELDDEIVAAELDQAVESVENQPRKVSVY
jgi:16S rRNA C1402 (ribose-2'-O) methylase RsmI